MSVTGCGARIAAAVFVAGLSVAGPYVTGVAVAETGEDDASSASANADPAGASPSAGPGRGRGDARPSRSAAGTSPVSASASQRVRVPGPAADGTRAGSNGGQRSGESILRRLPAAASGRAPGPAAARAERSATVPITDPGPSREAPVLPAAVAATVVPRVAAVADVQGAEVDRCENCWAFGYSGGGGGREIPGGFLVPARPVEVVGFSVTRVIDRVGNWLSTLPANPVTDLLSGGLWLLRRAISPVGAGVGLWGSAGCVATKDCTGQDLDGADLHGQDLAAVNFAGASLRRADLGDARLTVANLSDADLGGATLARASLSGATLLAADLTGASLAGASLPNADLGGVNLTDADLSWANLIGANIAGATLTGAIWRDTTCPDGSTSGAGCSSLPASENKPGLISSDWLEIVKRTGEPLGDEPVMVTVVMTTTLGVPDSTSVRIVDDHPNQIGSSLTAGNKVPIPNEDGDVWINYNNKFAPLTWDAWVASTEKNMSVIEVKVTDGGGGYLPGSDATVRFEGGLAAGGKAATGRVVLAPVPSEDPLSEQLYRVERIEITDPGSGYVDAPTVVIDGPWGPFGGPTAKARVAAPAPVPLILVATLMLEGDFTPSSAVGTLGSQVMVKLRAAGKELENTKVYVSDVANGDFAALNDASERIKKAVAVTSGEVAIEVVRRIAMWFASVGDPDDPVGVGVLGLIPLDGSFLDSFAVDLREEAGLDGQFMRSSTSRQSVGVIADGKVTSVKVDSGGYGYDPTNPPRVTFEGGLADGGVAATGRAILAPAPSPDPDSDELGYSVVGVEITSPGEGYTSAPKVVIDVEPLSQGATATASISAPTSLWDFDLATRFGFLVPPSYTDLAFLQRGGIPQGWETTYAGDYADNKWAEWKVETLGWPRINW